MLTLMVSIPIPKTDSKSLEPHILSLQQSTVRQKCIEKNKLSTGRHFFQTFSNFIDLIFFSKIKDERRIDVESFGIVTLALKAFILSTFVRINFALNSCGFLYSKSCLIKS